MDFFLSHRPWGIWHFSPALAFQQQRLSFWIAGLWGRVGRSGGGGPKRPLLPMTSGPDCARWPVFPGRQVKGASGPSFAKSPSGLIGGWGGGEAQTRGRGQGWREMTWIPEDGWTGQRERRQRWPQWSFMLSCLISCCGQPTGREMQQNRSCIIGVLGKIFSGSTAQPWQHCGDNKMQDQLKCGTTNSLPVSKAKHVK